MFIDTKGKGCKVWLIKFPTFITEKIHDSTEDMKIGTITLDKSGGNTSLTFNMGEDLLKYRLPTEYKIDFVKPENNMYIMKIDNKTAVVEGCVEKEFTIKPVMNKQYISFKKENSNNNYNATKTTQLISVNNFEEKYNSANEMGKSNKNRRERLAGNKRDRLERSIVMNIIFNAYEEHPLWTIKDLSEFTGQPGAYIYEIVSEICNMNKKDHRNTWELKPEYKSKGNR